MGKFFSKGEKFRAFHGKAEDVLPELPENVADMVFMDPWYNLDEAATEIEFEGRENLSKTASEDRGFDPLWMVDPLKRLLVPEGNVFAFTSFNVFGRWHEVYDPLYDTFQFMVWHKVNPPTQVRKSSMLNSIEQVVCFWNKGHKWNFTKQNEMHNFHEGPICMGKERIKHPVTGKTLHPHQKPLHALRKQILWCTDPGDVVLDPFGGVFSIGHAALELGRRVITVEMDDTYYKAGKERLERVAANPTIEQVMSNPWS